MPIQVLIEGKRGCGYRKTGGLYLMADWAHAKACCLLPTLLYPCKCCGLTPKFSRSWQWIPAQQLRKDFSFCSTGGEKCELLQLQDPLLLMWVGEEHYPTMDDYLTEAKKMGFSKRIPSIPKEAKPGQTWVALAHRKALIWSRKAEVFEPAIICVFRLKEFQIVVQSEQDLPYYKEQIEAGARPVIVVKEGTQAAAF